MNTKQFKSKMLLHGDTAKELSKALGISRTRLSAKINANKAEFKQTEITKIKKRYNLSNDEIEKIFFNQ